MPHFDSAPTLLWKKHAQPELSRAANPPPRLYAHRVARRHRDHRHPHRPAAPGRAEGPGGGQPDEVFEQPEADRPGRPQLREHEREPALLQADQPTAAELGPGPLAV